MHKGSCLCGAITFEVAGDLPGAEACHCTKCRKWSGHAWIGILMGAFDTPTQTRLSHHIFVAEKGDYYELDDGLPQNEY